MEVEPVGVNAQFCVTRYSVVGAGFRKLEEVEPCEGARVQRRRRRTCSIDSDACAAEIVSGLRKADMHVGRAGQSSQVT